MSLFLNFLFIFLFIFQSHKTLASQTTVFFHPKSSYIDYLAHIETSHNLTTPVDFYNEKYPEAQIRENLLSLFEQAQLAFSRKFFSKAQALYKNVVSLSLQDDWRQMERNIIFFSYINLAQLASTPLKSSQWLKKAISFTPQIPFPSSIKNKPLKKQFMKEKKYLHSKIIFIPVAFIKKGLIKINGYAYNVENQWEIPVYPGLQRISILTNQSFYFSVIEKQKKIKNLKTWFSKKALALTGDCQSPKWQTLSKHIENALAFYSPKCIAEFKNSRWVTKNKELQTFIPHKENTLFSLQKTPAAPSQASSKKNHWLWLGLSTLAIGSLIAISQTPSSISVKRKQH